MSLSFFISIEVSMMIRILAIISKSSFEYFLCLLRLVVIEVLNLLALDPLVVELDFSRSAQKLRALNTLNCSGLFRDITSSLIPSETLKYE